MKVTKVVVLGNSVALRNRPHEQFVSKNYGQLLQEELNRHSSDKLFLVENLAFGRATMPDLDYHYDRIINSFGDLYIINIGASDAATREIPFWFANVLNRPGDRLLKKILKGIHFFLIKTNRSLFVKLRGRRSWVSPSSFKRKYKKLLDTITHNTNGQIICVGLIPPNERVEKELPNTTKRYAAFDMIINELAKEYGVSYIQVSDLSNEIDMPDGTHLSQEGNQKMYKKVVKEIYKNQYLDVFP